MHNTKIIELDHPIMAMSISPDGTLLAFDRMDDADGTTAIALFDLQKRRVIPFGIVQRQAVLSISFSPDGKRIFAGIRTNPQGQNSLVQVWNIENPSDPRLEKVLPTHGITSVIVNQDTVLIESASEENQVIHTLITGGKVVRFSTPDRSFVVAMKAAGEILALQQQWHGNVDLWHGGATAAFLGSLDPEPGPISKGAFSPSGEILVLGQGDFGCHLQLWDVTSPCNARKLIELKGHDGHVSSLAFTQDERRLASGGYDRLILLWDISNPAKGDLLQILDGHQHTVTSLAFVPDGHCLISASIDGTIRQWPIGVA